MLRRHCALHPGSEWLCSLASTHRERAQVLINNLTIREATKSYTDAIHAIHVAAIRALCASVYTPEEIGTWSSNPDVARYARQMDEGRKFLLAVEDANIYGFGVLDATKKEIAGLFVHPDYTGKGIGAQLLRRLESIAIGCDIRLLRVHASLNAQRFYEKYGYKDGEAEKFNLWTGLQIDAMRLAKNLSNLNR